MLKWEQVTNKKEDPNMYLLLILKIKDKLVTV